MSPDERLHELLPWYVAGTLDPEEMETMRRHLAACQTCRAEMELLGPAAEELARHGGALLADHPSAERLVAAVRGELDDTATGEIRTHLALCAACATETRWIGGEAVCGGGEDRAEIDAIKRGSGREWWGWLAAAASLATVAFLLLTQGRGPSLTGLARPSLVRGAALAEGRPSVIVVGPQEPLLLLVLEADFPDGAFPLTAEIVGEGDRVILRRSGITPDDLRDGYLFLSCDRRDCTQGEYRARILPTSGDRSPIVLEFRVAWHGGAPPG